MMSYKKRWKIIQDEILSNKGNSLYIEKSIKNLIAGRYKHGQIDTTSTYVYQKMKKLLQKKVYLKIWNNVYYVREQGYINVFDLHKQLTEIIKIHHIPNKTSSLYTSHEKEYMNQILSQYL